MLRVGKPRFGKNKAKAEFVVLDDRRAYAEACEKFQAALSEEMARDAGSGHSTDLSDLVFTE